MLTGNKSDNVCNVLEEKKTLYNLLTSILIFGCLNKDDSSEVYFEILDDILLCWNKFSLIQEKHMDVKKELK